MTWDELVAAALIGTDRRPVAAAAPPGAPAALGAALDHRAVEDRLLASAAAWTVARRAGARPGEPVATDSAEPDPRPRCSYAAGARLAALLDGEQHDLVPEWLARAARAGLRPPSELIPELLEHAAVQPALHGPAGEAAGPLGRWLAGREPRWSFVRGATDDPHAVWADGGRAERRALLERLRAGDPAQARELLQSTFAEETWEDREAFLGALAANLSDADEPFLESALDDARKPVRAAAAALLAGLPGSRFATRVAKRVAPLLHAERDGITVTLPGPPDAAELRDGFIAGGRRAEHLTAMLAAAPLHLWSPQRLALSVADDLGPAVHEGWAEAAKRQGDAAWARALWPVTRDPELLTVLPRAEGEALAAAAEDPVVAARELRGQWGPDLSRAVLAAIRRTREAGEYGVDVRFAGHRLDPALELEAEALRELGGRDLWTLCDTLVTRAAMLRELA